MNREKKLSDLQICLFGKFQAKYRKQALGGLEARKVQELFIYLLLHRQHLHCRETLATLLWNNSTSTQSLKYLRQGLWQLQTTLDCTVDCETTPILLVDSDWIGLNPKANLWLDVAEFEQAFIRVRGIRGRDLDLENIHLLQKVVQLYQGDLLEGWYQDWCLFERERLQNQYLAMLDKLMDYCEAQQEFETGVNYGMTVLKCDRARERTYRRLMRLYYLAGDRTAALRQYVSCVAALEEELGVAPAKRTVILYEQMRTDQLNSPTPARSEMSQSSTALLFEIVDHLTELRAKLTDTQRQIEQDIQTVERALKDQQH